MRHSVGRKTNSFLFTFTCWSNSNQAYKKILRFYGAKKLGLDLYRIQIARSFELVGYISRSTCSITLAQGIPSQIRDDEQIICLPQSSLFLQGMGRKVFSM